MTPHRPAIKTILRRSRRIRTGGIAPAQEACERYRTFETRIAQLEMDRKFRKQEMEAADKEEEETENDSKLRDLRLTFVSLDLMKEHGANFRILYPYGTARSRPSREPGADEMFEHIFLLHHALYAADLLDVERRWNAVNRRCGQPEMIIVDWTTLPSDVASLQSLKYVQHSTVSGEVTAFLTAHPPAKQHLRCTRSCGSCLSTGRCCSNSDIVMLDDNGVLQFAGRAQKEPLCVRVECTDSCGCNPSTCMNRALQVSVMIMVASTPSSSSDTYDKGWIIRTTSEFQEDDVIGEYVGEILLERTTGVGANYDFELGSDVLREDQESRPFFVNSHVMGNEMRYCSHSCDANAYCEATLTHRDGMALLAIAIRAGRPILRGEELCIDYFPGKCYATFDMRAMFPFCRCQSPKCRFSEAIVRAEEEKEQRAEKMEDEEDVSIIELSDGSEKGREPMETDLGTEDGGEAAAADDLVEVFNWRFGASELVKSNGETLRRIRAEIAAGSWFLEIRDKRTYKKESTGPPEVPELITIDDDEAEKEQEQPGTSASHYGRSSTR